MQLPAEDRYIHTRSYWINQIKVLYGGHIAEKIIFNEVSTGAGNDIIRASDIARRMVCEWGMSTKLGPLTFGKKNEQIFLGREISQHRDYSELTAELIDAEVKDIVETSMREAEEMLKNNMKLFTGMAEALIERETLNAEEIKLLVNGEPLPPLLNGKKKSKKKIQTSNSMRQYKSYSTISNY